MRFSVLGFRSDIRIELQAPVEHQIISMHCILLQKSHKHTVLSVFVTDAVIQVNRLVIKRQYFALEVG